VLIALSVAAVARSAIAAGESGEAEALIRQGVQLRIQGKPERALPFFEKAYQTSRTPRTAAQLGLVELDLGYYVEAERYLAEGLAAPDHPWIAKNQATLKRQLATAKANIGEVVVSGTPAGAEVWLNGNLAGRIPLAAPIRLAKGRVDIQLRAPGYEPAEDSANIVGGKREQRSYALSPTPVAAGQTTTPVGGTPPAGTATAISLAPGAVPSVGAGAWSSPATTPSATIATAPAPTANGTRARRPIAWIVGAAAIGALAFGTVEAFNAVSKKNAFNDHTGYVGGVLVNDCGTASLSSACKPLKDSYDQALTLSIVGFVAAGVLASAASVWFLHSPGQNGSADQATSARALACVPDPADRALTCSLRF
jgi:hypothetical protein